MPSAPAPLTILITGASAGIGRITAVQLAHSGRRLILAARSADRLEETATLVRSAGCEVLTIATDVSCPKSLQNLVSVARQHFGRIDVLVNNAGIECFAELESLTEDKIQAVISTNLTGAILLTRLVLPLMKQNRFGRIINMASTAGKHGPAWGAVYGATKAAVIGMTKALAADYTGKGIRVNAICPGTVDSPSLMDRLKATGDFEAAKSAFIARQPMGRMARAEEIGMLVVYLASDEAAFVTGQTFVIDGGWSI